MRSVRTVIAGTVLVLILVGALSGVAFAYFSTKGAGDATAGVSKLSTLTTLTATPAVGGTVALSWTAVVPPGPGTVTYAVSRGGGAPGGTCPNSSARTPVTSCTDSGLDVGIYSYAVTAYWRSWSAGSSTATAKVTVGQVTHLDLKAASTTPTAGATNNLTITAQDANDNTVTTYTGSRNLTFSGSSASPNGSNPTVSNSSGTAIAFGSVTAISFSSGVAKVSSSKNGVMKLNRAGAASVVVSDGAISSAPLSITVSTGSPSRLAFTNVAISGGALSSICAFTCTVTGLGNSGTITANISVTDSLANTVSALGTGNSVKVTSTGGAIAGSPMTINSSGPAESATQSPSPPNRPATTPRRSPPRQPAAAATPARR